MREDSFTTLKLLLTWIIKEKERRGIKENNGRGKFSSNIL
jgi:hypothetical protein